MGHISFLKNLSKCPSVEETHFETLITHIQNRLGYDHWNYAINAHKISSDLGSRPTESFETGIQKALK